MTNVLNKMAENLDGMIYDVLKEMQPTDELMDRNSPKKSKPEIRNSDIISIKAKLVDKEISSTKLSCATINLSQLILHKQFPLVEGMEDTELGPLNKMSQ